MRARGLWAVLGLVAAAACAEAQSEPGTIAFTNVSVIPMDREGVLENQTVVVLDGVIREVGPAGRYIPRRSGSCAAGALRSAVRRSPRAWTTRP